MGEQLPGQVRQPGACYCARLLEHRNPAEVLAMHRTARHLLDAEAEHLGRRQASPENTTDDG